MFLLFRCRKITEDNRYDERMNIRLIIDVIVQMYCIGILLESSQREIQSVRKPSLGRNEERRPLPKERVARTQPRACVYFEAYSRKGSSNGPRRES